MNSPLPWSVEPGSSGSANSQELNVPVSVILEQSVGRILIKQLKMRIDELGVSN